MIKNGDHRGSKIHSLYKMHGSVRLFFMNSGCWASTEDARLSDQEEKRLIVGKNNKVYIPKCQPRQCTDGSKCWCCEFTQIEHCWDWHQSNECEANCPLPPSTSN